MIGHTVFEKRQKILPNQGNSEKVREFYRNSLVTLITEIKS